MKLNLFYLPTLSPVRRPLGGKGLIKSKFKGGETTYGQTNAQANYRRAEILYIKLTGMEPIGFIIFNIIILARAFQGSFLRLKTKQFMKNSINSKSYICLLNFFTLNIKLLVTKYDKDYIQVRKLIG